MKERVVVAGSHGFIGRHLARALEQAGLEVVHLNRSGDGVLWDGKTVGDWASCLEGARGVINLAGAPIDGQWTQEYKKLLRTSRIEPTQTLAKAISLCKTPPQTWINTSAIGYYGDEAYSPMGEDSSAGNDFLAEICREWEAAALNSGAPCDIKIIRIGFVLGLDGGAFPILLNLTRAFLGSAVGSGRQVIGWIHIQDLCRMFVAALQPNWPKIANGTAPKPVTNAEFMRALRRAVGRPWVPGPPAFVMRGLTSLTGRSAPSLALASQNAVPRAAQEAGFLFDFPLVERAIEDLLKA